MDWTQIERFSSFLSQLLAILEDFLKFALKNHQKLFLFLVQIAFNPLFNGTYQNRYSVCQLTDIPKFGFLDSITRSNIVWWWMVMALGALVVGGSGSRKYTHFWQEFQTNRKLSTYIHTTYTEKQKEHIIHIDDDVNMMRKMCFTSHQFFFFQLSSSLSELHELPTWWSSHEQAAILKTNSFCLQHHWRAVTWVSRLSRRRLFSNSSFNLFLTLYLILKKR